MCSGITAFSALKKIRNVFEGESILIVGLGGVGMMGLQFARALFPEKKILGADIDPKKLDAAKAGYVTKEQATKLNGFDFTQADKNKDGKLDRDEFNAAWGVYSGKPQG